MPSARVVRTPPNSVPKGRLNFTSVQISFFAAVRFYTSIRNGTAWKRNHTPCHPEEQTCLRQVKGAMNIGCPILRVLAKGGMRGCLPRDLFFPPLPKGHGKGGAPSLSVVH